MYAKATPCLKTPKPTCSTCSACCWSWAQTRSEPQPAGRWSASLRRSSRKVEGFYSYRTGESVLRLGGLRSDPKALRQPVLEAVDSPQILSMLDEPDPTQLRDRGHRCTRALAALDPEHQDLGALLGRVRSNVQLDRQINDGMSDWVPTTSTRPICTCSPSPSSTSSATVAVWSRNSPRRPRSDRPTRWIDRLG